METIYTDEMIEACARACHEAHLAAGIVATRSPMVRPWSDLPEDWRDMRRHDVRAALAGAVDDWDACDTCQDVTLAVARAMGWPRKP